MPKQHLQKFIIERSNRKEIIEGLKKKSDETVIVSKLKDFVKERERKLRELRTMEGKADYSEKARLMFELLDLKLMLFMHKHPNLEKDRAKDREDLFRDFLDAIVKTKENALLDEKIYSEEAITLVRNNPTRIMDMVGHAIRAENYELAGDIKLITSLKELKEKWKDYNDFRLHLENSNLQGVDLYAEIVKYFTPLIDSLHSSAKFYADSARKPEKALFVSELLEILHEAAGIEGGTHYLSFKNISKRLREQLYKK